MTTNKINEAIEKLAWQYVAGSGCANCWGDLRQGCESTCRSYKEAASERKTFIEQVRRIATLAATEEREACARIVERYYTECDTCRVKPGSPILCQGCLNNRDSITAAIAKQQVREDEREACARVCLGSVGIRQRANDMDMDSYDEAKSNGHDEALVMACAAIRARGQGNEKTV